MCKPPFKIVVDYDAVDAAIIAAEKFIARATSLHERMDAVANFEQGCAEATAIKKAAQDAIDSMAVIKKDNFAKWIKNN